MRRTPDWLNRYARESAVAGAGPCFFLDKIRPWFVVGTRFGASDLLFLCSLNISAKQKTAVAAPAPKLAPAPTVTADALDVPT